jgi:hypothetical protein
MVSIAALNSFCKKQMVHYKTTNQRFYEIIKKYCVIGRRKAGIL